MTTDRIIITLCILFYIGLSLIFLFYGNIHADESTYLYAIKMVLDGKILYRDFIYIQLPLLPYLYGFFLKYIGVSLLTGRLVSMLFSIGTVILSINISKRLGGNKVAILCALLLCLNPFQTYFFTITRVYSPATFFFVLSIFLMMTKIRPVQRNMLSFLSLSIAISCRLTLLPAILPILVYYYIFDCRKNLSGKSKTKFLPLILPLAASIVFFILTLLPFAIFAGFYKFFYLNLIFHLNIEMPSFASYIVQKAYAISIFFQGYFFISVLIGACLSYFWLNRNRYKQVFKSRLTGLEACLWFIVFLITGLHLTTKYLQPSYQVVIFPFACIVTAICIKRIYDQVSQQYLRLAMILIFLCGALITPVSYGRENVEKIDGRRASALAIEMGKYVKSITNKDDLILSSDTPLLAVEADRKLLTGFENIEYYPEWSNEMCKEYKVVNDEILENYIIHKVPELIIVGDLSFTMSMPNRHMIGNEKHKQIFKMIEDNYNLMKVFPNPTHGIKGTNTYIYKK